jgi:hypothetical protein
MKPVNLIFLILKRNVKDLDKFMLRENKAVPKNMFSKEIYLKILTIKKHFLNKKE